MRRYEFSEFGLDNLVLVETGTPDPGSDEVRVRVKAFSLNFRDLLVVSGDYNKRIPLPATPVSDAAGIVTSVGENVSGVREGDEVMTHFVADWIDGPFDFRYVRSTLGVPGPGVAAEEVVLPGRAVLPLPKRYDFAQAATLPIAALTAWSALVEGRIAEGASVLALGTGGVSVFTIQLAKAMGARVLVTSSSVEKLARAAKLGADVGINYRDNPEWEKEVLAQTDGLGVDLTAESVGIDSLGRSLKATRGGGTIALFGSLSGLRGELNIAPILMKRIRVAGILVDSRASFEKLVAFIEEHDIEPVIDRRFAFEELREAMEHMKAGMHFGKIVVKV